MLNRVTGIVVETGSVRKSGSDIPLLHEWQSASPEGVDTDDRHIFEPTGVGKATLPLAVPSDDVRTTQLLTLPSGDVTTAQPLFVRSGDVATTTPMSMPSGDVTTTQPLSVPSGVAAQVLRGSRNRSPAPYTRLMTRAMHRRATYAGLLSSMFVAGTEKSSKGDVSATVTDSKDPDFLMLQLRRSKYRVVLPILGYFGQRYSGYSSGRAPGSHSFRCVGTWRIRGPCGSRRYGRSRFPCIALKVSCGSACVTYRGRSWVSYAVAVCCWRCTRDRVSVVVSSAVRYPRSLCSGLNASCCAHLRARDLGTRGFCSSGW